MIDKNKASIIINKPAPLISNLQNNSKEFFESRKKLVRKSKFLIGGENE